MLDLISIPHTGSIDGKPEYDFDGVSNGARAEWAGAAIAQFRQVTGTDECDAIADMVGDVMHWADRAGYDFAKELRRGVAMYSEELQPRLCPHPIPDASAALLFAARAVVSSWDKGDLASAVRSLATALRPYPDEKE